MNNFGMDRAKVQLIQAQAVGNKKAADAAAAEVVRLAHRRNAIDDRRRLQELKHKYKGLLDAFKAIKRRHPHVGYKIIAIEETKPVTITIRIWSRRKAFLKFERTLLGCLPAKMMLRIIR